jgi:hypothetical protein
VVGSQFAVERAVVEHVPRGDDQGVFDGDKCAHRAAPRSDPLVLGGEERVLRPCRRHRRNTERAFEIRVAGTCLWAIRTGVPYEWLRDGTWPEDQSEESEHVKT